MTDMERWASRIGLVLAMAGNAVGLGNFLRFPAQAVQSGGGAFMIPYLVCFLVMGLPMLWIEWAMGRHGGAFGHHSTPGMFDRLGSSPALKYAGAIGLFINIGVAAYYCYIESWTLAYAWHSIRGSFGDVSAASFFANYVGSSGTSTLVFPREAALFFFITLGLNLAILVRGVSAGIERAALIFMPLLLLFAVALVARVLTLSEADPGVVQSPLVGLNFLWEPRLSGLWDPTTWLRAAGQVFFTLSLGMGTVHCYASYLAKNDDLALNAATAGWLNEFAEVVLGGSLLIPITVAYLGLPAVAEQTAGGSGFDLGFLAMPTMFQHWGALAPVAGLLWFGLLFFAGITSSLAMGQGVIAFFEHEFGIGHGRSTALFGLVTLGLGLWCLVGFPGGAFEEFDFWTGTFALVVFSLIEVVLFTRVFGMKRGWDEITRGADLRVPDYFRPIMLYVTPSLIGLIFLGSLFKPHGGDFRAAFARLFAGEGWTLAPDSIIGKLFRVGQQRVPWTGPDGPTRYLVEDLSRVLLLGLFLTCCLLVRRAWANRREAT